jgi:hypothetical protein
MNESTPSTRTTLQDTSLSVAPDLELHVCADMLGPFVSEGDLCGQSRNRHLVSASRRLNEVLRLLEL